MGRDDAEKAFDPGRDPIWALRVNSWPWVRRDEDIVAKVGPCPRCGHTMTLTDGAQIHMRMVMAPGAGPRKYAACNCGVRHPDTPEGQSGCGANGLVDRA